MAGGRPEELFLVGAVQVDVARFGIGVFGIDSVQPEDASLNVVSGIVGRSDASGGFTAHEDFADRREVAVFFVDDEAPGGRAVTSGPFADPKF